jgi:hypothetical protein
MAATPITASTRYFLPGTTKVYLLDTVADMTTGPSRAELDAGLDISEEVAAITGWAISGATVPTPDLGKRFTPQVSGRLTAADSGLTCWADKTGVDIRAEVAIDDEKFVVFLDGGDVTGSPMDVYQTTCLSVGKLREIEGAGRIDVQFSIRDYAENLAVPATV